MRPPAFWQHGGGLWPRLLAPAAALAAVGTARRVARPGWRAPVPVICCGNASVGGAGKTTLALDLGARLLARGVRVAFLTRGHGGRGRGRVLPDHDAAAMGDEALLLAALAPTFVGPDRAAAARLAVAAGAAALVMDDGLQNPGLVQDAALLVIDGAAGFGNGRVLPAGPLREPAARAAGRCRAAVLIGSDATGVADALAIPVLRARLRSAFDPALGPVFAFAGIGRPEKFFASLRDAGATLAGTRGFPDHHRYAPREVAALRAEAASLGAVPVTTPKDHVRLPPGCGVRAIGVALEWEHPAAIEALLREVVP